MGYSPWDHKESDTTERLSTAHLYILFSHPAFLPRTTLCSFPILSNIHLIISVFLYEYARIFKII